MLARRMPGILPPPDFDEALDITRVHSVAGWARARWPATGRSARPTTRSRPRGSSAGEPGLARARSRSPTAGSSSSTSSAEFSRPALEALRQPLEEGRVDIVRGQQSVSFPARDGAGRRVQPVPVRQERGRLPLRRARPGAVPAAPQRPAAGPDRHRLPGHAAAGPGPGRRAHPARGRAPPPSRARVVAARAVQAARLAGSDATCNGEMDTAAARRHVHVGKGSRRRLIRSLESGALSGRGHDRVLRLARTIADLGGRDRVIARRPRRGAGLPPGAAGAGGRVNARPAPSPGRRSTGSACARVPAAGHAGRAAVRADRRSARGHRAQPVGGAGAGRRAAGRGARRAPGKRHEAQRFLADFDPDRTRRRSSERPA